MDKERARFVLRSFRPDGSDVRDEDFAEALMFATQDRELGEWLVNERAFDAEFAAALAKVELPQGLRDTVLLSMLENDGTVSVREASFDGLWVGALAGIEVPEGLRERILEGMEQSAKVKTLRFDKRRLGIPLAAAAGIALAVLLTRPDNAPPQEAALAVAAPLSVESMQEGFVRIADSPVFSLDETDHNEARELVAHLRKRGLPCGGNGWPPGLADRKGLGCREIVIEGRKGSLICFDADEAGTVHLLIFMKRDVKCSLPDVEHPDLVQKGDWASARWTHEKYVFTLMGRTRSEKLAVLF